MSLFDDINKIGDNHLVSLLGVLAVIAPGLGALIVFYPHYIDSFDIFKLVLITLAFGFITITPTFMAVAFLYDAKPHPASSMGVPMFVLAAFLCATLAACIQALFWLYDWPVQAYVILHGLLFLGLLPASPFILKRLANH
jgi:hypothetical protein